MSFKAVVTSGRSASSAGPVSFYKPAPSLNPLPKHYADETIATLHRMRRDLACDVIATLGHDGEKISLLAVSAAKSINVSNVHESLDRAMWEAAATHAPNGIWLSDVGGYQAALLVVDRRDDAFGLLAGFETCPKPLVMRRTNSVAALIFSTLAELLRAHRSAQQEKVLRLRLEAALHELNLGVCLVSAAGKIEFANNWLRDLLAEHDGLRLSNGALAAVSGKDTLRLHVMIDYALQRSDPNGGELRDDEVLMLALNRSNKKRPLMLAAFPADSSSTDSAGAAAILLVVDTEADVSRALVPICRLNSLSPVETRLACHLAAGKSLSEASQAMHVKEQTARAYLRQIFQKTGTNRQAELVRLMMSSLLPMRTLSSVVPII